MFITVRRRASAFDLRLWPRNKIVSAAARPCFQNVVAAVAAQQERGHPFMFSLDREAGALCFPAIAHRHAHAAQLPAPLGTIFHYPSTRGSASLLRTRGFGRMRFSVSPTVLQIRDTQCAAVRSILHVLGGNIGPRDISSVPASWAQEAAERDRVALNPQYGLVNKTCIRHRTDQEINFRPPPLPPPPLPLLPLVR